jgi:hypothetical protein
MEVLHLHLPTCHVIGAWGGRGPLLPPKVVPAPTYSSLFLHLDPETSCIMQTSTSRAVLSGECRLFAKGRGVKCREPRLPLDTNH